MHIFSHRAARQESILNLVVQIAIESRVCFLLKSPHRRCANLRLLAPAIFIGDDFVIENINPIQVEDLICKYSQIENSPIWEQAYNIEGIAVDKIIQRFKTFRIPIILGAGILDGVNPCAFAIIIFLIIHLTTLKKTKKEVFIAGISFILAIYLSYFLLGMGLYESAA